MGSYYFVRDTTNELGHTPIPEEDMVRVILAIAKKHRLTITDEMIVRELDTGMTRQTHRKRKNKRIHLFVDGTNLFVGQNELFGPKTFLPFPVFLSEIKRLFPVTKIYFYASYMPKAKIGHQFRRFASLEVQFYRQVRTTPHLTFFKGYRSPTSGKEKGVDVHLAVDIVKGAFLREYDEAVIMTGDADLIYPLELVKSQGIPIHAVFFPNRFSLEMAYKATSASVLNFMGTFRKGFKKLPARLKIVDIKKPRM